VELVAPNHPLIDHKVTLLRDIATDSPTFRALVNELVTLLAYEATREVRVQPREVTTPLITTMGVELSRPRPLVVPILRAGLGMLEGMMQLMPAAEVGFLGMVRDEETLQPFTYAERLPEDLSGRQCYVLDPMLATGGSLVHTVALLRDRGAQGVITVVCALAAPEGIQRLKDEHLDLHVVTAAIDDHLNEHAFIVPGLGDAGDRQFGSGG
jgi:uracil phosphoribosyltransferase